MTVRQRVLRDLATGRLTDDSALDEVMAVGPYVLARAREHLGLRGAVTLRRFFARTRGMSTAAATRFLLRALQNARGNQCVPRRAGAVDATYHVQDVNHHAYEAMVALLDAGRARPGGVTYGPLPRRMPRRSVASKSCGCRSVCDGPCRRTDDGACVPRRGRGFLGTPPHPDQIVVATTEAARRRVRSAARSRTTAASRADAGARSDVARGHRRSMRYAAHRDRMSRVPSPKVRLPNRARGG